MKKRTLFKPTPTFEVFQVIGMQGHVFTKTCGKTLTHNVFSVLVNEKTDELLVTLHWCLEEEFNDDEL